MAAKPRNPTHPNNATNAINTRLPRTRNPKPGALQSIILLPSRKNSKFLNSTFIRRVPFFILFCFLLIRRPPPQKKKRAKGFYQEPRTLPQGDSEIEGFTNTIELHLGSKPVRAILRPSSSIKKQVSWLLET